MSELVRKVIEAGLVPKHTLQLLEKWRLVEPGGVSQLPTAAELEARTHEELLAFAQDIASLLEETAMPEIRETDPDLEQLFKQGFQISVIALTGAQRLSISGLVGVQARDGRLVLRRTGASDLIEVAARPGNIAILPDCKCEILSVEVRYVGDVPEFYICSVRKVDDAEV